MSPPPYRDVTVGDLLTQLSRDLPDRDALLYGPDHVTHCGARARSAHDRARPDGARRRARRTRRRLGDERARVDRRCSLRAAKIGAILVTANTSLRARDIDYLLRQSDAATLVTIRGFRDVDYVAELKRDRRARRTNSRSPSHHLHRRRATGRHHAARRASAFGTRDLRRRARRAKSRSVMVDDVINMQYTSGTTGFPKGVMLSSRNIVNNGYALGAVARLHAARSTVPLRAAVSLLRLRHRRARRLSRTARCLCPVESFDPRRVLETVHRERCTALYGVPTMFIAELECAGLRPVRSDVAPHRRHGGRAVPRAADAPRHDRHAPAGNHDRLRHDRIVAGHHDDAARCVDRAAVADGRHGAARARGEDCRSGDAACRSRQASAASCAAAATT